MHGHHGISVVIPVLDEAEQLTRTLPAVLRNGSPEVIVVDGGSSDDSPEVARSFGVAVLHSERGRGRQLNVGARAARAEFLLFLHADTTPPAGYGDDVVRLLSEPGVELGAFCFAVDAADPRYRVLEACVKLRCRMLRLPYGDQGLFMRRTWWARRGGFPESEMEDLRMVWATRSRAAIALSPKPAVTSARRWAEHGFCCVTWHNLRALTRFLLTAHDAERAPRDRRWTDWRHPGSVRIETSNE